MTYDELREALRVLGVGEGATLREIKASHRVLVKRHHPDAGQSGNPQTIRKVNAAYALVMQYLTEYRFSFSESEFYEQNPEERLRQQFMDDPLWGKG